MTVVAVLGSINTDLVIPVSNLPRVGETVLGDDLVTTGGGKGANQAVAASRLGAEVLFIGAVGSDDFGRQSLERLHAQNVNTQHIRVLSSVASGVALIVVDSAGNNLITVSPGANGYVVPEDVIAVSDILSDCEVLLTQLEIPLRTVYQGLKTARQMNTMTILNPAPVPPSGLPDDVYQYVDVITPNRAEAAALVGHDGDPEQQAKLLMDKGVHNVIITLGEDGALVATPDKSELIPPFEVQVVDTTAAGDAFSGGLGVALLEGKDLFDAARFATAASSLCVTRQGAQQSMPARAEVERLLNP